MAVSVCGNQSIVGVSVCVCVHEKERDRQSSVLVCVRETKVSWKTQKGIHKM